MLRSLVGSEMCIRDSSNANDIVTEYLLSQKLIPKQAVATLSNAMDVGNPVSYTHLTLPTIYSV